MLVNGTFDDLRIDKTAGASLVVTSTTNSQVSIGQSTSAGNQSAQLLYTPGTGRLDINNYDVGGVSVNLHEGTGAGTTEVLTLSMIMLNSLKLLMMERLVSIVVEQHLQKT